MQWVVFCMRSEIIKGNTAIKQVVSLNIMLIYHIAASVEMIIKEKEGQHMRLYCNQLN